MTLRQKWKNNLRVSIKIYFCLEIITKTECELRLNGVKANDSEDYFVKWDRNGLLSMR